MKFTHNYTINRDYALDVLKQRKEVKNDYSCVIKGDNNLYEYKNIINIINHKISNVIDDKYIPYENNLHITAIGMEGYGKLNEIEQNSILKLICEFPTISISEFNLEILENGLIVTHFYLNDNDKQLLKNWRLKFKPFGFTYKHEMFIFKLHSVFGMFDLREKHISTDDLSKINKILEKHIPILNNQKITFNNKNVDLYFYKYTSFLDSYKIENTPQ